MLKKCLIVLIFMIFQISLVEAATHIKVAAVDNYNTQHPASTIKVVVLDSVLLGKYSIPAGSLLHSQVMHVTNPKRGKRNAVFYVKPDYFIYKDTKYPIKDDFYGKYSERVLSKEELKKIPPSKIIKSTAVTVGNFFVKGLSLGVSMVEGVIKNEENNRLKSGAVKVYKDSPLSYVEEGEQLEIKIGDEFYFVFKYDEDEEPNYTYRMEDTKN